MTNPFPSFLPNEQQAALLEAIFCDETRLDAKIDSWLQVIDFQALDAGSSRLLPLLAGRIGDRAGHAALVKHMRSIRRYTWVSNRRFLHRAQQAAEVLGAAGIQAMALKGVVLASHYYGSLGDRPMADIDLLVPRPKLYSAIETLTSKGWRIKEHTPMQEAARDVVPDVDLICQDDPSICIDLHSRLLKHHASTMAEERLWANAMGLLGPLPGLVVPSPADMLVHVCVHGAIHNPVPPIRWVADAVMILRKVSIDWRYFEEQCGAWGVGFAVAQCLDYLAGLVPGVIPHEMTHRLSRQITRREQRLFQLEQKPDASRTFLDVLFLHWQRTRIGPSPRTAWLRFLRYLVWRAFAKPPRAVRRKLI